MIYNNRAGDGVTITPPAFNVSRETMTMKENTINGVKTWTPTDPSDKALLVVAEGATFSNTTFPSGWTSPAGKQVCQGGILVDVT
jgi:hypothetical protein